MRHSKLILTLLLLVSVTMAWAQKRDINLTINVSCATGESLEGQTVECKQTDYSLNYETVRLDANGSATLKIYSGNNSVTVNRPGYAVVTETFNATADLTVSIALEEDTKQPFSLTTAVDHNALTGKNNITFGWNKEAPVFSDDFESYEDFSIKFGEWTGIDGDGIPAAALSGDYKNRSAYMYAQIINPMTVVPSWWYDYEVLRPYSGQQYVGFICTTTGAANDDWLISPAITPGTQNYLTFMGKAGDVGKERFQVYVTEKTDNPTEDDFVQINAGNYETAEYQAWKEYKYDLSEYEGKTIKFAIRYISSRNSEKTFMLMIDDVYVGQIYDNATAAAAKRVAKASLRSPMNPNETFKVYLNGVETGETDNYEYVFKDLDAGTYTLGVKAFYKAAESEMSTTTVTIPADNFAKYAINVSTNNGLSADGYTVTLVSQSTGKTYAGEISGGKLEFLSLPYDKYLLGITANNYDTYEQSVEVNADASIDIVLKEKIYNPYNITADVAAAADNLFNVSLRWNQNLGFSDSFEDYEDFAQGSFGEWKSIDLDQKPVYSIGLGSSSNIVDFPGASTPDDPKAIAPIVFNAWTTTPAMYIDPVILPPSEGRKQILFFSPQGAQADKWLISPQQDIRDGYVLRVTAKSYQEMYAESFEFCVSTTDAEPSSFKVISTASNMSGDWTIYETDLSEYAGQKIYVGIHYVSYDTMWAQLDDFYVGSADGEGETADVGAVKNYQVYLDGEQKGTATEPAYTLTGVTAGTHTAGVKAVYESGMSELTEYQFNAATTGISGTVADKADAAYEYFTLDGRKADANNLKQGVYIRKNGNNAQKVVVK